MGCIKLHILDEYYKEPELKISYHKKNLTYDFCGENAHSGLLNMNGRMYDPVIGRVLSPDRYVVDPFNAQDYNRYTYCRNNPLIYIDPSGEAIFGTIFSFVTNLFTTLFVKGGLDFTSKSSRQEAWKNFDPSASWSMTNKAWQINMGLYKTDPNKTGGQRTWEFVSRFTWQGLQTGLGYVASQGHNLFGGVKNVSYYGGATVIESYGSGWGAAAFSNFIIGRRGITNDPADKLFQHEYGHYIQSQKLGPYYLPTYGLTSLVSAGLDDKRKDGSERHDYLLIEQNANTLAFKYFSKHVDGFNKYDENGNFIETNWNYNANPIKWYDWDNVSPESINELSPINPFFIYMGSYYQNIFRIILKLNK